MSSSPQPAEPAAPESPIAAPSPGALSPGAADNAPAPTMDNMFGSDDDNAAGTNDNTARAEAPEEGGEGGEEGEAAYVPATESSAARIPSFKKRRGSGEDEGDDDEERQRRKKQKKEARAERRARAAAEEEDEGEDEPQLDEATRRRLALEERIDAVGKTNRAPRRKKKGDDIDVSSTWYDDLTADCRGIPRRRVRAFTRPHVHGSRERQEGQLEEDACHQQAGDAGRGRWCAAEVSYAG